MTELEEFRETHRIWSTNNARAMSALNRDLAEERRKNKEILDRLRLMADTYSTDGITYDEDAIEIWEERNSFSIYLRELINKYV